jgi:hypothetical protein
MTEQVNRVSVPTSESHIQQAAKKLEIGWMGLLFGDATEKPGNIAALAILLAFVGILIAAIFVPDVANSPKRDLITLFGGIITGAMGFLFGRSSS